MEDFRWTDEIYSQCQSLLNTGHEQYIGAMSSRRRLVNNTQNLPECLFVNTVLFPGSATSRAIQKGEFIYDKSTESFTINYLNRDSLGISPKIPIVPGLSHYICTYNGYDDSKVEVIYFKCTDQYYFQQKYILDNHPSNMKIVLTFCKTYCNLFQILVCLKAFLINDVSQLVHSFLDMEDYVSK